MPSRRMRRRRAASGQTGQCSEIATDQCFFLGATPAFHLTLGRRGIFKPVEMLVEHQLHWPTQSRVAFESSTLMLSQSLFQSGSGGPDVVGAVGAAQDVEIRAHLVPPN